VSGKVEVDVINAQYNLAAPESFPVKIAGHQRRKMFKAFIGLMSIGNDDTILDVGVTSDRTYDHSNYLEAWYPHKAHVTAVGIDNAVFIESLYPGIKFVQANGCSLPFKSRCFDFVHSSAVLEHVGSRDNQVRFLRELWRVSRKGIFVTTPNRWFPIEFHTVLPLLHWLPVRTYRKVLITLGKAFFAAEENLNLLSRRDLARIARTAEIGACHLATVSLLGLPTNLLLVAHKRVPVGAADTSRLTPTAPAK
jgi:ubiquinone/menaquinone biosynthesis C-methylase UbiE